MLPVDPDGFYVGRVAGLNIGMADESCALQVNRACGSGTQAIITAAQQIMTGHGKIALAGGGENFSRGGYVNQKMRWGVSAARNRSRTRSSGPIATRSGMA